MSTGDLEEPPEPEHDCSDRNHRRRLRWGRIRRLGASTPLAHAHPKRITLLGALGRLSMQLITATCEDGLIRQQEVSRIRVRDEALSRFDL